MLGQTSQIFAEAELAYRMNRVIDDYAAVQSHHWMRWPLRLRPAHRQPRRPRPVMPAPHHAISH